MKKTVNNLLVASPQELRARGWRQLDVILISGDAYIDHPAFGVAVIGRVLEASGYKVGIISQPDWRTIDAFASLGAPRLFFGITSGNVDSLVANYTANKKPRNHDDYSPDGAAGRRPDRATIVYANKVREAFRDAVVVLGGIEASLRRLAHYDYWDEQVRRSLLVDAKADILVYGMGERQIVELARRIDNNLDTVTNKKLRAAVLAGIRGTVTVTNTLDACPEYVQLPSFADTAEHADAFNQATKLIAQNQDPYTAQVLVQQHGGRFVIHNPPQYPLSQKELDYIHELPYTRMPHPVYQGTRIKAYATVKHSVIAHRGCVGECNFCGLSLHQGRIIQTRSKQSIIREIQSITRMDDFNGTITDIGGPTANLYGAVCHRWQARGACSNRHCIAPKQCRHLKLGYQELIDVLESARAIPRVKHVFLSSGFRYDLLTDDNCRRFLEYICKHHISGQMKVAPEHIVDKTLAAMNKPSVTAYKRFLEVFQSAIQRIGKKLYLVNYFIASHPQSTLKDALQLALYLSDQNHMPLQIQDFIPLPMTVSGAMYYTGKDPFTGKSVYVARTFRERKLQRALVQYKNPANKKFLREALGMLKQQELIKKFTSLL